MKRNKIIKLIKEKNNNEVEFTYDYASVANKLDFQGFQINKTNERRNYKYFFKFSRFAFSILIMAFVVTLAYVTHTYYNKSQIGNQNDGEPTEEVIFEYFNDNNIKYIDSPIKTEVINNAIVNIYFGLTQDDKVVFAYQVKDSSKNTKINVKAVENINDVDIEDGFSDFLGGENSTITSKDFTTTFNDSGNTFLFVFTYSSNVYVDNQPKAITIDVSSYIEYLNENYNG